MGIFNLGYEPMKLLKFNNTKDEYGNPQYDAEINIYALMYVSKNWLTRSADGTKFVEVTLMQTEYLDIQPQDMVNGIAVNSVVPRKDINGNFQYNVCSMSVE